MASLFAQFLKGSAAHPVAKQLDEAAKQTNTEPTEAQQSAGNYAKGKIRWNGLTISIENPKGSTRSGTSRSGKKWQSTLKSHYGYFLGFEEPHYSRAKEAYGPTPDGDHLDCFIGDDHDSQLVFAVDQIDPKTKEFDECKFMLGFSDIDAAEEGYLANYEKGWKGLGSIVALTVQQFKSWLKDGEHDKPLSGQVIKLANESLGAAEASPVLQQPAPFEQLMAAHVASKAKDYQKKVQILRALMQGHPSEFAIDSRLNNTFGITHGNTGFRYHLPIGTISDIAPGLLNYANRNKARS